MKRSFITENFNKKSVVVLLFVIIAIFFNCLVVKDDSSDFNKMDSEVRSYSYGICQEAKNICEGKEARTNICFGDVDVKIVEEKNDIYVYAKITCSNIMSDLHKYKKEIGYIYNYKNNSLTLVSTKTDPFSEYLDAVIVKLALLNAILAILFSISYIILLKD